jgi:hypothetical protein
MTRSAFGVGVVMALLAILAPRMLARQPVEESVSMPRVVITVGETRFIATLQDNATARAFAALLPLTIAMKDLNGNEKFAELPSALPAQASRHTAIRVGDLMLYGSDTLVLFYESFSTTYSYTKIGQIDDASGLEAALGRGGVRLTFEAQPR